MTKKRDNIEASRNMLNEFAYLRQHCEDQDSHQNEAQHDKILQIKCQGGDTNPKLLIILGFG